MKISKIIFANISNIMTNIPKRCHIHINDNLSHVVDTFVKSPKEASNVVEFLPYRVKINQPFIPKQYKKADSIAKAKQYAEDVLGIESFDIDDLELANQVNLTMTRAFNRTKGKITPQNQVKYTEDIATNNNINSEEIVPMQNVSVLFENSIENILEINKNYFDNIDIKIQKTLNIFEKNGQLTQNSKGLDQIELITPFHYDQTLNRYYRLYNKKKLTPKAKVDFENLLINAYINEEYLLMQRKRLSEIFFKDKDINLNNLPNNIFKKFATAYLLKLRRTSGKLINNPLLQTKRSIGIDGMIYHELGHSWHSRTVGFHDFKKYSTPYNSSIDATTTLKISNYASKNKIETVAELISGLLSGDKYSEDVMTLGNQLTDRKLKSLI